MPVTRETHPLRRGPEPASLTPAHPPALHEFPSAWWTVLHATQPHAKLAPASRKNDEQSLDIEVASHEGQEAKLENVINFNSTPDIVLQPGLIFEL
jgi:hypothetical protein